MADKQIGSLPKSKSVDDDSLFVIEQQGIAMSASGAQWKGYAQAAVSDYVESAHQAAENAVQSASYAAESAEEAAQSAREAAESAEHAEQYSGKPPMIQDGTWWIWNADTQEYEDTGEAVRGNVMFATFYVDMETGDLIMITPDEYMGPNFLINEDGYMEVSVNA